jgi:hypothetical protein
MFQHINCSIFTDGSKELNYLEDEGTTLHYNPENRIMIPQRFQIIKTAILTQ